MNNLTVKLKIQQRLNKLSSNDYSNIQEWQLVEAFNKAHVDWSRRQLVGSNMSKTGDEQTVRRIDDLQVLLVDEEIQMLEKDGFFELSNLPADYFEWKRLSVDAFTDECCDTKRRMIVYLGEEANLDLLLEDENKKPSFEWGETFCTMRGNTLKLYTNNEFKVGKAMLTYYRQPTRVQFIGVSDPNTGLVPIADVISDFKDDVVEVLIDECVKILSGDIEHYGANQVANNSVESNN